MFAVNNHIQRARLLLQQGRLRDAEKEIGFALRENPDDAEALLLLAECKVDGKHYDEAIQLLHNCIALEPDYHRNYYMLSFCHYRMSKRAKRQLPIWKRQLPCTLMHRHIMDCMLT